MKIKMTKHAMTRIVDSGSIELLESAGWVRENPQPANIVTAQDIIKLKAPAKSKGADKSPDNTIEQGDE